MIDDDDTDTASVVIVLGVQSVQNSAFATAVRSPCSSSRSNCDTFSLEQTGLEWMHW